MATFQGGASSDAAPLVLEIIKLTNLPKREHDRTRCPFLRVHLEPADAPPPLPPRSPEVSPKDLAKLMAQKSLSEEDAARVKDALATGTQPEEQKKGRWSRTRAAAAALQKKASSTTSALRARAKEHLDETRAPPNAPGSTEPVETSQRPNTLSPQFFAFLRVAERCTQDDVVVLRVHDAAATRTKYLGEARVPVGFLSSSTTPFVVELAAEKHRSNDACEVHVRRVPVSTGPPRTVSIILVRHGSRCYQCGHHISDAPCRSCICSMAWRFYAIDATSSPLRQSHWSMSTQAGTRPSPTRTTRPWFRRGTTR